MVAKKLALPALAQPAAHSVSHSFVCQPAQPSRLLSKMTQVISLVAATAPKQAMTPAHSPMDAVDEYDRPPRAFRSVPDTPDSPSPRTAGLARKRAASINTADANYGRLEKLQLSTPSSMNSEGPRDICLCTPAPKIPRPRNGESSQIPLLRFALSVETV